MPTPYRYIERYYDLTFTPGDRVEFTEGEKRTGVVLKPNLSHMHYVNVRFDDGSKGLCHPKSLAIQT